jgi:hypothetical protein
MIALDGVTLGRSAIPYVAALDGALRAAGLWEGEPWLLAGLSGMAFPLVVDPATCPASPTAYGWSDVHAAAAERVGAASRCVECIGDAGAYPARRDEALRMVTAALDAGRPAVVRTVDWAEFAIVVGYDDEDRVLFLDARHADPVLYDNLGSPHGFPFLFAQVFDRPGGPGLDLERAAWSSLAFAVVCWRDDGFPSHPWYDFAVGAAGYGALVRAIEVGDTDPLGLRYILRVNADARASLDRYLRYLVTAGVAPGLGRVAEAYAGVAPLAGRASELLPSRPPFERELDRTVAGEAAAALRRAADLEESAIADLEAAGYAGRRR